MDRVEREERVEKRETLAEIVAALRHNSKALMFYFRKNEDGSTHAMGADYVGLADRIEAARNRELGNVAAMREALEAALYCLQNRRTCSGYTAEDTVEKIRAALAAKPRNCDMPLVVDGPADNNADKAWIVFKRHNPDAYFDVPGLLRCIDWLYAPATEGGAA